MNDIRKLNYKHILADLNREISKLNVETESIHSEYAEIFKNKDSIDKIRKYEVIIANLLSSYGDFTSYWQNYCQKLDKAVIEEKDVESEVINAYNDLVRKCIDLIGKHNELTDYVLSSLNNLNTSNKEVLNTIDEASSSIKYFKSTKVKGESNPHYKVDIRTEDLIQDYIAAGLVLNDEVVAKYNKIAPVTYNGLRKRLIEAGVWKRRQ